MFSPTVFGLLTAKTLQRALLEMMQYWLVVVEHGLLGFAAYLASHQYSFISGLYFVVSMLG